jgi:hypothetical protein
VSVASGIVAGFRRLGIVLAIATAFLFGLASTVYLSLRSPEVTVPNVVGKNRFEAEHILGDAGLNFRVRANRPSREQAADTVLFQLPRAGEVVKAGQTVAMDISRTAKEGEAVAEKASEENSAENRNTDASEANANTNENRPKRTKNTNNANENLSAKENLNVNAKTSASPVSVKANTNAHKVTASDEPEGTANTDRDSENTNASPVRSANQNRRPPAPKPSPSAQNANRPNP